MKRISLLVFVLLPAVAFGQSGSAQLGPLHLPFDFKVTVSGTEETTNNQTGSSYAPISFQLEWIINPTDTGYHESGDTISYSWQEGPGPMYSSWFTLIFDSASKTISQLSFGNSDNSYYPNSSILVGSSEQSISLSNLAYDSSSIYATDSSLAGHDASAGNSSYSANPAELSQPVISQSLTSITSMVLSGSFRPTTLTATSSVAMPAASPSGMFIGFYNGAIQCEFSSSDHPRMLEVFTPLGVKAASAEIPAAQTEISLPHLMSGLYFVRMDGDILKIAVP